MSELEAITAGFIVVDKTRKSTEQGKERIVYGFEVCCAIQYRSAV